MFDQPLVFVDIDTQRDFLDPSGALYVPGSQAILGNLGRLTAHARTHAIPVLATACAHRPEDAELRLFPPHCMAGTPGQLRIAATTWTGGVVLAPEQAFDGPVPQHLTVEKRTLDFFERPDADRLLALYQRTNPQFVVYGVATEYCVRYAVLGLLARDCRVLVVADAVRAIDLGSEPEVLGEFVSAGAILSVVARVTQPDGSRAKA
ncbi:MAG: cysteine hydrolase [Isosphaeraceae bacterium]|nr:cysteine hydrolase [Isosphaeraceae bacterium]